MSTPNPTGSVPPMAVITSADQLPAQTRDFAAPIYTKMLAAYLDFRRKQYHETNPQLHTPPAKHEGIVQTESAKLAQQALSALKFLPRELQGIVLIRDLLDQLQWEVDIHTLTENERTTLHNIAFVFLHGIEGGIQPWYVEWLLQSAHNLQTARDPNYYLAYPWQSLLYHAPHDLAAFDAAVARGDIATIEREIEHLANGLYEVLADPLSTQPRLAFSGPDGERRRVLFQLKTGAGLALGAYLAVEQIQLLLHPRQPGQKLASMLPPLPQAIQQHMLPEE